MQPMRALLALASAAVFSCNAILGIEDLPLRASSEGGPADDGAASDAAAGSGYSDEVLKDRPVLYLRLGEPAGATIAHDEKGRYDGMYQSSPQCVTYPTARDTPRTFRPRLIARSA
jgi:hypothetical protein